jgi:hypothetical protein
VCKYSLVSSLHTEAIGLYHDLLDHETYYTPEISILLPIAYQSLLYVSAVALFSQHKLTSAVLDISYMQLLTSQPTKPANGKATI